MSESSWDVAVIGAGAAGLMAALRAAELCRRVLLLEKNRRPGVKILMSGGTRCNITHATDNRGRVEAVGPPGPAERTDDAAVGGGVCDVAAGAPGHEDLHAGPAVLFQQQRALAALGGARGRQQ